VARSLDIETLIEDAFLTELPNYVDSDVAAIRWEDIKDKTLTPCVKVKATITDEEQGTLNLFCASNVLVDFGIFTSKKIDEDGKTANGIRGDVRSLINQDNIVTLLNAEAGLLVYTNGIIPQTTIDIEDDKIYQKNLSILVVATSTE
jgi:hypothetical protein